MKQVLIALLYTAGVWLANPALADVSAAAALRDGDMKKLNFHSEPKDAGSATFTDFEGTAELALSDYEGKWVLVNFWATWCAPCRKEMPHLAELQDELGGDDFEVVTIATGRNPPAGMKKFFAEIGVDNLPMHRDPKSALAREMGVLGLPITVILNPEGQEIARLQGDADWASDNAKAILTTLIGTDGAS
ncbi:Thiol-disulfide isomerase or thioredoxin [Thalassococcus halodurans]|jgi:thiol-disulfide isomerase/thioredoxin|uniref:Thiol-disulfide isomerase or thioredoxin n=1 Tax=Thalassococcus halodurans TaxID=373675 RepID=A0A1H5Z032_9RHOB|nr:TlpA disulfide reductase family protein [Thalassococcus halodurans]SEG29624.1 Thiol-disulfide isomerase or thioredoxin [Thalassococcus halodurans]